MSIKSVKEILNRAHDDESFRNALLDTPEDTLKSYDLTENELSRFKNITAEVLVSYKNKLDNRLSKDGSSGDDDWWVESVTD